MIELEAELNKFYNEYVSDFHITAGGPLTYRCHGDLVTTDRIISPLYVTEFISTCTGKSPDAMLDCDFAAVLMGKRARCSIFHKQVSGNYDNLGACSMVIRMLSDKIPVVTNLKLPVCLDKIFKLKSGLVLFTGITGSGKSTSMASIINEFNVYRGLNILTIEDPIEYVYPQGKGVVSQREVGKHVESFLRGARMAMREDVDIVLIGEIRDYPTLEAALNLAETGHLVFSSIHTRNCVQTIDRAVTMAPNGQQSYVRSMLATVLAAVVHQDLVPSLNGDRVPLIETMFLTPALSNMLTSDKPLENIRQSYSLDRNSGSMSIVDSALVLQHHDLIDPTTVEPYMTPGDYDTFLKRGVVTSTEFMYGLGDHEQPSESPFSGIAGDTDDA